MEEQYDYEREAVKQCVLGKLRRHFGRTPKEATPLQLYKAVSMAVRDEIMDYWQSAMRRAEENKSKVLYYLSLEFLMGKFLAGNLIALEKYNLYKSALADIGISLEQIEEVEQDAGLGNGETPIFPIHIFKVKEGINYNEGDPNYDLFKLACRVSAKRLFPNFSFIDAPYNLQYYKPGNPDTEIAYMGCRTRVIGNAYDPTREIVTGRGNLSFTSINLPRLAIESKGNIDLFYEKLDAMMDLVVDQLLSRFKIQSQKRVKNFPFLMGQGIWIDSDKIGPDDSVAEILKHGTLSIGFIGLAETLKALTGKHHGESEESRKLGLEIITHMRKFCDDKSKETHLNFTLLATPAEGLSGRFVRIDKKKYGIIPGVTDRDYYTNSFHVPVYYPISAFEKLDIEAPYHALTNAGHISYVELDGDTCKNPQAFEAVIRHMKEVGIGYGSVNHPVDRDPVCGFTGVIDDVCPRCGRREGEPVTVERLNELRKKFPGVPVPCDCNH